MVHTTYHTQMLEAVTDFFQRVHDKGAKLTAKTTESFKAALTDLEDETENPASEAEATNTEAEAETGTESNSDAHGPADNGGKKGNGKKRR